MRQAVYAGKKTLESMKQAKFYNKWLFSKFDKYLTGNILEVGCGIGSFTNTLSNYGRVVAIDIDQSLIEILQHGSSIEVSAGYGDIEKGHYFFQEKAFDTIVCLNVLEHIEDDQKALQNMYKLLKKGGRLILLIPIYQCLYGAIDKSLNHYRRYNPSHLQKELEKVGFTVEIRRKLNWLGALGWFIAGRLFKKGHVEEENIKIFNFLAPVILRIEDIIEPPVGISVLLIAQK